MIRDRRAASGPARVDSPISSVLVQALWGKDRNYTTGATGLREAINLAFVVAHNERIAKALCVQPGLNFASDKDNRARVPLCDKP
jgi:hypothetical protein